jgi:hypothetical protein
VSAAVLVISAALLLLLLLSLRLPGLLLIDQPGLQQLIA